MAAALVWLSPAAKDLLRTTSLLTKGSLPCPAAQFAKLLAEAECDGLLRDATLRKAVAANIEKAGNEVSDANAAKLVDALQAALDGQMKTIKDKSDAFGKKLTGKGVPAFADVEKLLPKGEKASEVLCKDTMLWHAVGNAQNSKTAPAPAAKIMTSRLALAACAGNGPVAEFALQCHVLDNLKEYVEWEKSFPASKTPATGREVGFPFDKKLADEVATRRVLAQALPVETATAVAADGVDCAKILKSLADQARKEAVVPLYTAPSVPAAKDKAGQTDAKKGKSPKAAAPSMAKGAGAGLYKATVSNELQWQLMSYRVQPRTMLSDQASGAAAPAASVKSPKGGAATAPVAAAAKSPKGGKAAPAHSAAGGFPTVWQTGAGQVLPPGHTSKSWGQEAAPSGGFPTVWATAGVVPPGHTDFSWRATAATGSTSKPKGDKKGGDKKAAPAKAAPAKGAEPAGAVSETVDVSWGDLRVGHILDAKAHPDSDKLCVETIDVGEDQPRQILSGILNHMKVEDVKGAYCIVICNLKARKLAGMESAGMVLCAHDHDRKTLAFVSPPKGSKAGERVTFAGFSGDAASVKQMDKKKAWEAIAPELKTNGKGDACYKGAPFTLAGGVCTSPVKEGVVS